MKIEFHPSTVDDVIRSEIHYKKLKPGLDLAFRAELVGTLERIRESPYLYPEVNGVRRALLRRFPFSVIYRIEDDENISCTFDSPP